MVLYFAGNPNMTCGGEAFVLIYGPLEGSLVQQQCEWYAGLYNDDEVTRSTWVFHRSLAIAVKIARDQ